MLEYLHFISLLVLQDTTISLGKRLMVPIMRNFGLTPRATGASTYLGMLEHGIYCLTHSQTTYAFCQLIT